VHFRFAGRGLQQRVAVERLGLDLAHALAGDAEHATHLLDR
jgi:hypothetical protein